jgi:hypothetical protein
VNTNDIRSGDIALREDLAFERVFDSAAFGINVRWTPRPPRSLRPCELQRYRVARDAFVERVHALTGVRILVVEA